MRYSPEKKEDNFWKWAIWIIICIMSSCAALAAAIAVVILISQHWVSPTVAAS